MKKTTIILMVAVASASTITGRLAYRAVKKAKAEIAETKAYAADLDAKLEVDPDAEVEGPAGEMVRVDELRLDEKTLETVNRATVIKAALTPAIGLLTTLILSTVATAVLKVDLANPPAGAWDVPFEDIPQVDAVEEFNSIPAEE